MPGRAPLLSLAAVTEDGSVFNQLILPRRRWWALGRREVVSAGAARVNGYTEKKWGACGAVELETARWLWFDWLRALEARTGARLRPVAHNAGFDRAWLAHYGLNEGLGHRWECSMALLSGCRRAGLVGPGGCSLDDLCRVSGTSREEPHDALSDARACLFGYLWMIEKMKGGAR